MNIKPDLNKVKSKRAPLPVRFMLKPFSYKLLVAEALFWVGVTRIVIRFLPFRFLKRLIDTQPENPEHASVDRFDTEPLVREISNAVVAVSRWVPWECKCLVQASAAKIMLNKRGVSNVMCLGISKSGIKGKSNSDLHPAETEASSREMNMAESGKREMRPHAWLIAGGEVILGGHNLDDYVTVSRL